MVDAGVGADETKPMLHDQNTWSGADDLGAVAQNDLHQARIFVHRFCQGIRLGRWVNFGQAHIAVFGFGNDFLGQNQDVISLQGDAGTSTGFADKRSQIIARLNKRDAGQWKNS